MHRVRFCVRVLAFLGIWCSILEIRVGAEAPPAVSAGPPPAPSVAEAVESSSGAQRTKEKLPPPLTHYQGRQIANTMHSSAAAWLLRDAREREEDCATLLKALGVKPGQTVCDLGCGNGFYTLRLADLVGPKGKVYAVDIQPEMLSMLKSRAKQAGVSNVVTVVSSPIDPRLPEGQMDLVLMVDVYHEFSHPEQMLKAIRKSLKPNGRLAVVEFREEDPKVPIQPLHKMSKKQVLKELSANGFQVVEEFDRLPWQHLLFFGRDAGTNGKKARALGP